MQIIKTVNVQVSSIAHGKMRPTAADMLAAQKAAVETTKLVTTTGKPVAPVAPAAALPLLETKDCIQITLDAVDTNGRVLGRQVVSLCEGKLTCGSSDPVDAPDTLASALTTAFAEVDKAISALIAVGKINL